jgi:hypothetical protein
MEFVLEFIFELIFAGIIEGSQNKKVPMPIRIICGLFLAIFYTVIIGGIIFLSVHLLMKKEYLAGACVGILALGLLIGTIFTIKKQYMKKTN